jgi:hypothetical protein
MSKINIRSPYHIYRTLTDLTEAKIEIYIYTGHQEVTMVSITYTLISTAYDDAVSWEISELVKDYLDITFDGTYESQAVFVNYQITDTVSGVVKPSLDVVQLEGFDGYGYFEQGANPVLASDKMQTNSTIYKLDDAPVRIPIHADVNKTVKFYQNDDEIYSQTITASTDTTTLIKYVSNVADGVDSYKERVIEDGGTFEDTDCLDSFIRSHTLFGVDKITITVGSDIETITVINIQECKYTPYKATFINKYGALQDLWFFKASQTSLKTSKNSYKGNIVTAGSYSVSEHQNKILNKQGDESLTLNTGYYPESYNDIFREFELSEKVWIEIDSVTLPIEIKDSSFGFKTSLNDSLISYTIKAEFAFDKINSVR